MKITDRKSHSNVVEMVRDLLPDDPGFADDLERHIAARSVGRTLSHLRASAGLSEAELAAKLGWKTAKVEKIEVMPDANLKLGDILAYAKAIDFPLTLEFRHDVAGNRQELVVRTIV